jgi:hypothetical protein
MPKKLATPTSYKYNPDRTDNYELDIRLDTLLNCITNYWIWKREPKVFENELKRMDINRVCEPEMLRVKEFINKTGARYENVYAPVTPSLEDVILNQRRI